MRVLIQRVKKGAVTIDGALKNEIKQGYVILVAVGREDDSEDVAYLVRKTVNLRIFYDSQGKMNLALKDIAGEALVISQFTLYANTSRGNRPSFEQAAAPDLANQLYQEYIAGLLAENIVVKTGEFAADMLVDISNDGPVTILLESPPKEKN